MNIKRYAVAGGLSVAIHLSFMLVDNEQKVFAMPSGSQSSSVSLNFVAQSAPAQAASEPPKQNNTEPKKETTESASSQTVEPKPAPLKKKKVTSKPPKKVVKTERDLHKNNAQVKKKQQELPDNTPKENKTKSINDLTKTASETDSPPVNAQAAIVNKGVSSEPILLETPSFSTTPVQPRYPRIARKRGIEGTATYEIWLDESGNQTKQVLVTSSGATILDKTALDAIKQWQFTAYTVKGVAVAHRIQIPVRFKLD
ncbi:energy transducer TonB [Vibrio sp. 10N.261.51.F12]